MLIIVVKLLSIEEINIVLNTLINEWLVLNLENLHEIEKLHYIKQSKKKKKKK